MSFVKKVRKKPKPLIDKIIDAVKDALAKNGYDEDANIPDVKKFAQTQNIMCSVTTPFELLRTEILAISALLIVHYNRSEFLHKGKVHGLTKHEDYILQQIDEKLLEIDANLKPHERKEIIDAMLEAMANEIRRDLFNLRSK